MVSAVVSMIDPAHAVPADHLVVPGRFRVHAHPGTSTPQAGSNNSNAPSDAQLEQSARRLLGYSTLPPSSGAHQQQPQPRRRRLLSQREREQQQQQLVNERTWLLRPSRERVETWLDAWWKRWMLLVIVPSAIVRVCAWLARDQRD